VRRVTPDVSGGSPSSISSASAPPLPRRQIEPEPEPEEEVIWAEALYDYDSGVRIYVSTLVISTDMIDDT
jgi:hypothetical protein